MAGDDRFAARCAELGIELETRTMPESTHTAKEAADAVGCEVGAIVKSLLFTADGEPLLLLVSGPNRVDVEHVSAELGQAVTMADAKSVRVVAGYSIGGVPPFGHPTPLRTLIDADLLGYEKVWAAAGTASTVFPISPVRLQELAAAEVFRPAP